MKKPAVRHIQVAGLVSLAHTAISMARQGYRVQAVTPQNVEFADHSIHGFCVKFQRVGVKQALAVDPQIVDLDTGAVVGSTKE